MFKRNKLKLLNKKSSKIISVIDVMKTNLIKNNESIIKEINNNENIIERTSEENKNYSDLINKNSRIIDRITSFLD